MQKLLAVIAACVLVVVGCGNDSDSEATDSSWDRIFTPDGLQSQFVNAGLDCESPSSLNSPQIVVDQLGASPTHTINCGGGLGAMVFATVAERETLVSGMYAMACEYGTSVDTIIASNWVLADDSGNGLQALEDLETHHDVTITTIKCNETN